MVSLVRILGEAASVFPEEGEEPSPSHPFITLEGPDDGAGSDKIYLLTVEGCAILRLRGLPECLLWWAAAHFVLNQRVANPVRNTVWFMFENVLQVPCEKRPAPAAEEEIRLLRPARQLPTAPSAGVV